MFTFSKQRNQRTLVAWEYLFIYSNIESLTRRLLHNHKVTIIRKSCLQSWFKWFGFILLMQSVIGGFAASKNVACNSTQHFGFLVSCSLFCGLVSCLGQITRLALLDFLLTWLFLCILVLQCVFFLSGNKTR